MLWVTALGIESLVSGTSVHQQADVVIQFSKPSLKDLLLFFSSPVMTLPSLPSSLAVLLDQSLCAYLEHPNLKLETSVCTAVLMVSVSSLDWPRQGQTSPPA